MVKNKKYNGICLLCMLLPVFLSGMRQMGQKITTKPITTAPKQLPGRSTTPITYTPPSTGPITTSPVGTKTTGSLPQENLPRTNVPIFLPQPKGPKIATVDIQDLTRAQSEEKLKDSLPRYEDIVIPQAERLHIDVSVLKRAIPNIKKAENIPQKKIDDISQGLLALETAIEAKKLVLQLYDLYNIVKDTEFKEDIVQNSKDISQNFISETDAQKLKDNYDLLKTKVTEFKKSIKNYADELVIKAEKIGVESGEIKEVKKAFELIGQKNIVLTQQQVKDLADELENFEITIEEKELDIEEEKDKAKEQNLELAQEAADLKAAEEQKVKEAKELESKITDQEKELEKDVAQQENIKEELDASEKEFKELEIKKEETILDKSEQKKIDQEMAENKQETEDLERKLEEKTEEIERQKEILEKEKPELEQKNEEIKELDAQREVIEKLKIPEEPITIIGQKQPIQEVPESTPKIIAEEGVVKVPIRPEEVAVEKSEIPKESEATIKFGEKKQMEEVTPETTPKTIIEEGAVEVPIRPEEVVVEKSEIPKELEVSKTAGQKKPMEEVSETVEKKVPEVKEVKEKEEKRSEGDDGEIPPKIEKEEVKEEKEEQKEITPERSQLPIQSPEEIISPQEKEVNIAKVEPEVTSEVKPISSQPKKEKPVIVPEKEYQPSFEVTQPTQSTISPAIAPSASQQIRPLKPQIPARASQTSAPPFRPSIRSGGRADVSPESVSAPGSTGITLPYTQRIDLGPRVPEKVITPPQEITIEKKEQPKEQVWWEKLLPAWIVQRLERKDRIVTAKAEEAKPESAIVEEEKEEIETAQKKEAGVLQTIIETVKKPIINAINYVRVLFGF